MSDFNKTVSVIVPAYNVEKYIRTCISSLTEQTYKDIEILVVNDGSSDNTLDVINECAAGDVRVKVISKENGGVSSARNKALSLATGAYIAFLDADDEMEPAAIETMVKALEESGADFVNCQYSRWDEEKNRLEDFNFLTGEFHFKTEDEKVSFITQKFLDYLVGFEVWNKLFKTEIIKKYGLEFSEKCKIGEDLAFNLKYLMHADKLRCIEDRCVKYTIREGSAMGEHTDLSKKIDENLLLLEDIRNSAEKSGKNSFLEKFPLLFVKVMDNANIGHTPVEITEAYKRVQNISFAASMYKEIANRRSEIVAMYSNDIAKIKYRYHLYVGIKLGNFGLREKAEIVLYNIYRCLRNRETLSCWKMPY